MNHTMNHPEKFHKLTPQECRQMYASNLIDAAGYILLIIKTHGAAGWKWGVSAREFCRTYGIKIRTFYQAIKRLVEKGLIEAKKRSDILLSHIAVPGITIPDDAHTYSPDCTPVQHDDTEVQHDVKTEAEIMRQQEFQNVPDISQTSSDFESEEESEKTAAERAAVFPTEIKEEEIKEEELTVKEIKLTDEVLAIALKKAEEGIKPSIAVCNQLRDSKYATSFIAIALIHDWNIRPQTKEPNSALIAAQAAMAEIKNRRNKWKI